jgi:FixJ family two-component response regulator
MQTITQPAVPEATVFVVDDEPIIRRSLSRLLRAAGFEVHTFASPAEFLNHPLPMTPACVFLDMCLGTMTGLQVQDILRQNERKLPVIFLTAYGTVPDARTGFRHGAEDFLEKPAQPADLLKAVRRAIERDRRHVAILAEQAELRKRYESLTAREREVMACVVTGLLNKQTAAELGITEKTIKTHRARVMEKMRVESLAALVVVAERIGIGVASTAPAMVLDAELWPSPRSSEPDPDAEELTLSGAGTADD